MWLTQWTFVLAETFLCVSLSWHTQCTTAIYRERSRSIFICIYGYTEAKKKKNNYDYLYFTDRVCVRFFPRLNLAGMEQSKAGELLWNQIVYVLMCAWNHVADSSLKKNLFWLVLHVFVWCVHFSVKINLICTIIAVRSYRLNRSVTPVLWKLMWLNHHLIAGRRKRKRNKRDSLHSGAGLLDAHQARPQTICKLFI